MFFVDLLLMLINLPTEKKIAHTNHRVINFRLELFTFEVYAKGIQMFQIQNVTSIIKIPLFSICIGAQGDGEISGNNI